MKALIQLALETAVVGATIAGAAISLFPSPPPQPIGDVTPFAQTGERGFSRLVWFGEDKANPIAGEFWIAYGRPAWKDEYAKAMEAAGQKRWRLGADAWTTLDTHVDITIGGQKVARGAYYVVLERPDKDKWNLVLLDPVPLRVAKMDAFGAGSTSGGIVIPLKYEKGAQPAERLAITIASDKAKKKEGTIEIGFGPHKLTAKFVGSV
jgi:Protein of unknown function (DUF2911)